jgi:hypothetical protein
MFFKKATCVLLILLAGEVSQAQFHLPSLDIQFKMGATVLNDMHDKYNNIYDYVAPNLYGEINWNATQYFAVGVFASQGVFSDTKFTGEYGSGNTSYGSTHFLYGAKIRVSTGRQPRFRPFAELSYGTFQMVMEKSVYRVSSQSNFFGISFGLMIRLNSKLYLVIPQLTVRNRADAFFFEVPGDFMFGKYPPIIELNGGLSYNIGKKK